MLLSGAVSVGWGILKAFGETGSVTGGAAGWKSVERQSAKNGAQRNHNEIGCNFVAITWRQRVS